MVRTALRIMDRIEIREEAGLTIATSPDVPGCQGIGPDPNTAVRRLQRVIGIYQSRPLSSPFATVRARLGR